MVIYNRFVTSCPFVDFEIDGGFKLPRRKMYTRSVIKDLSERNMVLIPRFDTLDYTLHILTSGEILWIAVSRH